MQCREQSQQGGESPALGHGIATLTARTAKSSKIYIHVYLLFPCLAFSPTVKQISTFWTERSMPCSVGTAAMLGECSGPLWVGLCRTTVQPQPSHVHPIGCSPAKHSHHGMEQLELSAGAPSLEAPTMRSVQSWVGRGFE